MTNVEVSLPFWIDDLPQLLGIRPRPPHRVVEDVRSDYGDVEAGTVLAELAACPGAHEVEGGWVSLLAVAEGSVLTHLVTEDDRTCGALHGDDIALWRRLAHAGLPLATGGTLVAEAGDELRGPAGWLDAYEPGRLIQLRLIDGEIEVEALDPPSIDDEHRARVQVLLEFTGERLFGALTAYLERRDDDPDARPALPMDVVQANLLVEYPRLLVEPMLPFGAVVMMAGIEVVDGFVGLPGVPWDEDEAGRLDPVQILARVRAASFLMALQMESPVPAGEVREFFDGLAVPGALAFAGDRVEREPLAPAVTDQFLAAATTAAERAAARFLAARSAEGEGDAVTAEQHIAEALRHDPDLIPVLRDAADYAATRGDATAADEYLRRAGVRPDDPLRWTLGRLLGPAPSTTGRNQPCPCGSGRKHKVCCLRGVRHPLTVRASLAYTRLLGWVERAPRRHRVEEFKELVDVSDPQAEYLALDLAIFETGAVEDYLTQRGGMVPADEVALIRRWCEVTIQPYEVTQVRDGREVTLRPLRGGDPVTLVDRSFSACVDRLDLVVARILHNGERPTLIALPRPVSRRRRAELLRLFDEYSPQALAAFFGPQPPPLGWAAR